MQLNKNKKTKIVGIACEGKRKKIKLQSAMKTTNSINATLIIVLVVYEV